MRSPTGVLLIANNFPPVRGGSAVVYDNIARFSDRAVTILAAKLNYADGLPLIGWREHDRCAPYRVHRLKLLRTVRLNEPLSHLKRYLFLLSDIWIRLKVLGSIFLIERRERHAAICIGELLASGWLIGLLQSLFRRRVLIYVHGEELSTTTLYDPDGRRRVAALHQADAIIAVSRFTYDLVLSLIGPSAASKVALIGNGVSSLRFSPGQKRADILQRHDLENAFVFVSVCRLLEKKGIDNTLRAFASIQNEGPEIRYLVVGTGPYHSDLEQLASSLGIADRTTFAGLVSEDDLVDYYRVGDVFVMPNRKLDDGDTEGFGLVFLEANSCGLPVIAGNDGGSTDAVQDEVNGLVVDGRSVEQIAQAMRRLRDDKELWARLHRGGLAVAAKASWADKAKEFVRVAQGARADGVESSPVNHPSNRA